MEKIQRLYKALNYEFKSLNYLKLALTHRSAGIKNNERLEFLGDSILNFIISEALFKRFPEESEGKLSRLRASLVKGETLAKIGLDLCLGDYLLLGTGELKSGGYRRESILADALEAVFAAIYQDGGIDVIKEIILKLYEPYLHDANLGKNLVDFKTQLQEYLQAKKLSLPQYTLTHISGQDHEQQFHVSCTIPDLKKTMTGQGDTRRKAEQNAAEELLNLIQQT